ncbi:MAG TPA: hypothetical protein VFE16_11490 [Candidatus Cybelea sp.]|nr:hypothetical protein [Candidatus Cybelea sp.]
MAALRESQPFRSIDPEFRAARKAHPAFVCSDYERLLARLRGRGVAVISAAELADGRAHCYVDDPFGNRIELLHDRSKSG